MHRRFRPRLGPSLLTFLGLLLFTGLGWWQLQRAEEKRLLQAEYNRRLQDSPVRIEARLQPAEELRFHRVIAKGYYEPAYQVLLDNRVHQGRAGYQVVTPLRIAGGEVRVLINRGWIPLGEDRARLPQIPTPAGLQQVRGVAVTPLKRVFAFARPPSQGPWQPVWEYLDMERYAKAAPFAVQPVAVLLDPANAAGFVRVWERLDTGIATHQGYAFQWFALAGALFILYLITSTHKVKDEQTKLRS